MSERIDEFHGADIAVVSFTDPKRLGDYVRHLGITFPVVSDVELRIYGALGIERGTRRQIWSFGTIKMYWRLLRAGRRMQQTDEDTRQLGADVVVGADGRILRIFRPPSPDTRPTVDELIAALPE